MLRLFQKQCKFHDGNSEVTISSQPIGDAIQKVLDDKSNYFEKTRRKSVW